MENALNALGVPDGKNRNRSCGIHPRRALASAQPTLKRLCEMLGEDVESTLGEVEQVGLDVGRRTTVT